MKSPRGEWLWHRTTLMVFAALTAMVVVAHLGFVAFVLGAGTLVARWPRLAWLHLSCALYAVGSQIVGWPCPLTLLEKWLRRLGGEEPYAGEFLPHYVWSPLGLSGSEPAVAGGLVALIVIAGVPTVRALAGTTPPGDGVES